MNKENNSKMNGDQIVQTIPPDDVQRELVVVNADENQGLPHIGLVGDTYTILLSGKDTNGKYCLIDMHVPPGGGPPAHRHDFEETFTILEGEVEFTFRGEKQIVRAGATVNIPANAPHNFHNSGENAVRMLCLCSPAGQEEFFMKIGVPVAARTAAPPQLSEEEQAALKAKILELAPKYKSEMLRHA